MNLRVDLILEDEKRSANVVNAKSLARIAIITVPIIIIVMGLVAGISVMHSKIKLKQLTRSWELAEQKQEEAKGLRNESAINNRIKIEIQGWRESHINWYEQLLGLQRIAPLKMQFTKLRISQTLQLVKNKFPARHLNLTLSGKAVGPTAESDVNHFISTIRSSEVFTEQMEDVIIKSFAEDREENASRDDRVFEIECIYKPREFRKPRQR